MIERRRKMKNKFSATLFKLIITCYFRRVL